MNNDLFAPCKRCGKDNAIANMSYDGYCIICEPIRKLYKFQQRELFYANIRRLEAQFINSL